MKLSLLSTLSTMALLSGIAGCSSGDDDVDAMGGASGSGGTGQAGKGGTGGAGTAGTGTGGSASGSGGTAGSTAGSGGSAGSASGGGGAGGGAAGGASDAPSDVTQAGIEAFLAAKDYRDAAWASDQPAPHDQVEQSSPHGRVQVWFNGTLRTAVAASQTPRPSGSMIVKELYDAGTNVVGHAVMVRSMATTNQWIYYCVANEDSRCASGSMANTPSYSLGTGVCSCHGAGTVITPVPPP